VVDQVDRHTQVSSRLVHSRLGRRPRWVMSYRAQWAVPRIRPIALDGLRQALRVFGCPCFV